MSSSRKTLEGLSDLDNLLAELEGLDNPKSSERNSTATTVSSTPAKPAPATNSSAFSELDDLMNHYENRPTNATNETKPVSKPIKDPEPVPNTSARSSAVAPKETPTTQQPATKPKVTIIDEDLPSSNNATSPATKRQSTVSSHTSSADGNLSCGKCNSKVTGEHIKALNRVWHLNCFSCDSCSSGLRGDFFESDGRRLCKNCTESKFRCTKCGDAITGEYFQGDGRMLHPHCLDKASCAKCGLPIQLQETTALGKKYHPECFVCTECNSKLAGTFYDRQGQPFCKGCLQKNPNVTINEGPGLTCGNCGKGVSGSYISYSNKNFHEDCFTCSSCHTKLTHTSFYNVDGKPTCGTCANGTK